MRYIVKVSRGILVDGLTTGYEIKDHVTVTEGLPPNCEFLGCQVSLMGDLELCFKDDIEVPEGTAAKEILIHIFTERVG